MVRDTYQWCCTASAPMLSIGGVLVRRRRPGRLLDALDLIEVTATSGDNAALAPPTDGTADAGGGDSSATLRYTLSAAVSSTSSTGR